MFILIFQVVIFVLTHIYRCICCSVKDSLVAVSYILSPYLKTIICTYNLILRINLKLIYLDICFVQALESLVARQPVNKPLDHIIVETSGLAHPGPVASLFWVDEELESNVKLDGIFF